MSLKHPIVRRICKARRGFFCNHNHAFVFVFIFLTACQPRKFNSRTTSQLEKRGELSPYQSFCDLNKQDYRAVENKAGRPQFWSRKDIEENIDSWKALVVSGNNEKLKAEFEDNDPKYAGKPNRASVILTAYATAYKQMTAERDRERCKQPGMATHTTSPMVAPETQAEGERFNRGKLVNMINHALADIMTRNIVNISKGCLQDVQRSSGYNSEPVNARWEFCDLYFDTASKTHNGDYNSMTVAMSSTMIYLTSHISGSLAALPFLDRLWVGTPFALPLDEILTPVQRSSLWNKRIEFMQNHYEGTYDQFNAFLSKNIDTVAHSLYADNQVKATSMAMLANFVENKLKVTTKFIGKIFGRVRSQSFNIGIDMAKVLANDPDKRKSVSLAIDPQSKLQEIHPFLVARKFGPNNDNFYYEIREIQPVFGEELLGLNGVKKARGLTWKHRIDVESWLSRRAFYALGAISYEDGFNPAEAKTRGFLASFVENIVSCFDKWIRGHLEKKALAIKIDDVGNWHKESENLRDLSIKEVKSASSNVNSPVMNPEKDGDATADEQSVACEVTKEE